jgi:hypothetical protein
MRVSRRRVRAEKPNTSMSNINRFLPDTSQAKGKAGVPITYLSDTKEEEGGGGGKGGGEETERRWGSVRRGVRREDNVWCYSTAWRLLCRTHTTHHIHTRSLKHTLHIHTPSFPPSRTLFKALILEMFMKASPRLKGGHRR